MMWHIFKKDVRLLWWLAAGVAALHFAEIGILLLLARSPSNRELSLLGQLLAIGGLLAVGFLITAAVHQDAIPGVRQDWLVRPILRRDLLMAKLLFVVLMVQLPIMAADFLEAAVDGFPLGSSLAVAASRSFYLMLLVNMPFLAFGALTKNLLEAITGGVVLFFLIATLAVPLDTSEARVWLQPTIGTGMEWITASALIMVVVIGAAAVLKLQFFRRRTLTSRFLMAALTAVGVLTSMMPWQPAFALQKSLSTAPGSARPVTVAFNPSLGRLKRDASFPQLNNHYEAVSLFLPMRVSGLPVDAAVQADRADVRIIEAGGRVDSVQTLDLGARRDGAGDPDRDAYHTIAVSGEVYNRIKDQPVRLEINDSLTLFEPAATNTFPVASPNRFIPGFGRCSTRINLMETAVQVRCDNAGRHPVCVTSYLEHVPTGLRNPERFECDADYTPFLAFDIIPDALARFGGVLPFRDPNGLAKYPVDGSKLKDAQVVIRAYQPLEHFERKLTIPEIRLSDWEADQQ
jgi:hypothetical protein